MGIELGYLQNKIRELTTKIEDLDKAVNYSLDRETRLRENLKSIFLDIKAAEIDAARVKVSEVIKEEYGAYFKEKADDLLRKFNESILLQSKGFNKAVTDITKECILLRKDNNFLMNLIVNELKIPQEELKNMMRQFDKAWKESGKEQEYENFKVKIYTDAEKVRTLLQEKNETN